MIYYSNNDLIHQALGAANSPVLQGTYTVRVCCVWTTAMNIKTNQMYQTTTATAEQSTNKFQQFIYSKNQIAQFIGLAECEVPHHPVAARNTGNQYSQVILHHLSLIQFTKIIGHLTKQFFWDCWRRLQYMATGPPLCPCVVQCICKHQVTDRGSVVHQKVFLLKRTLVKSLADCICYMSQLILFMCTNSATDRSKT